MCPRHSTPRPSIDDRLLAIDIPRATWIQSARCSTSLFYQRTDDGRARLCPECYTTLAATDKETYYAAIFHYIHFGPLEQYEKCYSCDIQLATPRDLGDCPDCSENLDDFIDYLENSGDQPWLAEDRTIVGISRVRL